MIAFQVSDRRLNGGRQDFVLTDWQFQFEAIQSLFSRRKLRLIQAGPPALGAERERLRRSARVDQLQLDTLQHERFAAGIFQVGSHFDAASDRHPVLAHQQQPVLRAAEQASLRDVADELGVELIEKGLVEGANSPQLAAAQVKHATGAEEMFGQIDGLAQLGGGLGIVEIAVYGGPGLDPFDR